MNTNYISQFFNKDFADINIDDLKAFFSNKQEENSKIEFKSGEVEIHDIFKEIAAFLNTEGGLLIIGAPIEHKEQFGKKIIKYCIGDLTYSRFLSKDWLHQKIYSNITPSPIGIVIKEISAESGNIFIIDVPQSSSPPHQSNADGRYYIRIDSEARPAPHGLVQALFDRRKKPLLAADLERSPKNNIFDNIGVSVYNKSNIPADKASFIVDVYNVDDVIGDNTFTKRFDKGIGHKFSTSTNAAHVLVSVMRVGFDFLVQHKTAKYLISVSYWSKEFDFDSTYFIIDPLSNTIVEKHWLDSDAKIFDLIRSLE